VNFKKDLPISQLEAKHNLIFLSIPYNYIANKSVPGILFSGLSNLNSPPNMQVFGNKPGTSRKTYNKSTLNKFIFS
jgi:hypothetical protein